MTWVHPKVNWVETDFYNIADYTRIRDNILWIKSLADGVVDEDTVITKSYTYTVPILVSMSDKTYTDITFASVLNSIENNFATINTNTHDLEDTRNTFQANGTFITYTQLNDLESKIQLLHDWLLNDMTGMRKTQFTLANGISQKGVII